LTWLRLVITDMPAFFARLNPNGRMVVVGVVAGFPPADFGMTMMATFQKSLSFATSPHPAGVR
jgi:NADPH:quinone reductase